MKTKSPLQPDDFDDPSALQCIQRAFYNLTIAQMQKRQPSLPVLQELHRLPKTYGLEGVDKLDVHKLDVHKLDAFLAQLRRRVTQTSETYG